MPADPRPDGGGRTRVAVLFGGRSTEHSISCLSAGSVIEALREAGYDVVPLGITRAGAWLLAGESQPYRIAGDRLPDLTDGEPVHFVADGTGALATDDGRPLAVDVVFPVLHGPFGEDGTIQGLLEMYGMPYVGSGVYASAASMDKAHMKSALASAGLPVAAYEVLRPGSPVPPGILDRLGSPVFVKPARGGSSLGISKVRAAAELEPAVALAAESDSKVIVESGVVGREVECGVLAGPEGEPLASVPAEITIAAGYDFYDFEAKYLSDATTLTVPADLPPAVTEQVQRLALAAYEALDCSGLARVDVFVCPDGGVVVNELNTMPGFTATSMYPRLWEATGVKLPALVDALVRDALRRAGG